MAKADQQHRDFLKEVRTGRLESYRYSPQDVNAHFSDEGQIQSDYHKRFAFELIQNADDAMEDVEGEKKVRFEVWDGVLLVANTGRPIDDEDVRALCTMSYTTKSAEDEKRASIGHKGRGFSSVLEITEKPQVYSTGISFEFNRDRSLEEIEAVVESLDDWSMTEIDGVPLMRLPFSPEDKPDRVQELLDQGYNTVFRFPLKNAQVEEDVTETISSLDRNTVLFLQELKELEIKVDSGEEGWKIEREEKDWNSESTRLKFVSVKHLDSDGENDGGTFALFSREEVKIGRHTDGIDENTWGDVEYTQIGVALRVDEGEDGIHLTKLEKNPYLHVFLPTEEESPIPVLVNGAFHTAISRTNINVTGDENNYNGFLLLQVANLLATDVRRYAEQSATTVEEFIECLDFTDYDIESLDRETLNGRFISTLQQEFADVEFVPQLEKLATGENLSDPGIKSVSDIVLPFYSSEKSEIAEAVALIYGEGKLRLEELETTGWFPKTTLLEPGRAAILEGLGASVLEPEEVPMVLGSAADGASPLQNYPNQSSELAIDPILEVLIWIWKTINGNEELVEDFKQAAKRSEVFPVGVPDNGVVRHVAKDDETEFFVPPRSELPDIELSGIQFLTPPVYRPEKSVDTQTQSSLVEDLKPGLEAIWDVSEFDFEEVVQAAVFPKLPSPRNRGADDRELMDKHVLELIRRLGHRSVDSESPLPFIERDGTLHRLSLLPVPTRDGGWEPAYRVYFGEEWQSGLSRSQKIEPLLHETGIDEVSILAEPESLPGNLDRAKDSEKEGEDEESLFSEWKSFFQWLGVSRHIRLEPLFDPMERRRFTATHGISRPEDSSILTRLDEDDWSDYRDHLLGALDSSGRERRKYDSIYQLQGIEYFNQYLQKASSNSEVAELFLRHIVYWWQEDLRNYNNPILATSDQRTWGRRNQNSPFDREERRLGLNLWLWQLKRASWCPSNRGRRKPEEIWMPTESVKTRFAIADNVLLPVLSDSVLESASEARDLLHKLGIRSEVSQKSFNPDDAEIITETVADMFSGEDDEIISESLRQIKPVYRYLSELLPDVDRSNQDNEWLEAQEGLSQIQVLSHVEDSGFEFEPAHETYFVRSPDVLDRIPVKGVPVFVLQEDDAVGFGTYFGLLDLEEVAEPDPEFGGEDSEKTKEIVQFLEDLAPYILCRLEAERPSQKMINDDLNGMDAFLENMMIVEDIEADYRIGEGEEEKVISSDPDFFLDQRGRGRNERPLPFVRSLPKDEDQNRLLARALCEYLGVSQYEGVITLLNAETDQQRRQYLRLAGAPSTKDEIDGKRQDLVEDESSTESGFEFEFDDESEPEGFQDGSTGSESPEREIERRKQRERIDHPVYDTEELEIEGSGITITTEPEEPDSGGDGNTGSGGNGGDPGATVSQDYRTRVDKLGMSITIQYEIDRLHDDYECGNPEDYVFDIHDEDEIRKAQEDDVAGPVLDWLNEQGLPMPFPGFDILTVNPETGKADRLIELKSSGHDTRTPPVTWNEWKTASTSEVQDRYYLYIVGNLRKDVQSDPYIRELPNPFGLLNAETKKRQEVKKEVKVNVRSFKEEAEIKETSISVNSENNDWK